MLLSEVGSRPEHVILIRAKVPRSGEGGGFWIGGAGEEPAERKI